MLYTSTDKMQTVIYHIDNDFIEKYGNCETLIDAIINDAQERKHPKIYTEQKLKDNISDWKIRLYMCDSMNINSSDCQVFIHQL